MGLRRARLHAGAQPDPTTGARATPIYQTTAYVFDDVDHAASLFNLHNFGYIYSRLTQPDGVGAGGAGSEPGGRAGFSRGGVGACGAVPGVRDAAGAWGRVPGVSEPVWRVR